MTWCVARKCFQSLLNKVGKDHPLCLRQEMLSLALSANFSKRFGWLRHKVHDFEAVFAGRFKKLLCDLRSGDAFASKSWTLCLRSEEHTSELQSQFHLVCRLLLEK